MVIYSPLQLIEYLKPNQRLLGLDLGEKTIGLATSDTSLTIATPLTIIIRYTLTQDISALVQTIRAYGVGGIIAGLPVQMDGTEGAQAMATRAFISVCMQRVDVSVAFWDERLSSSAAERILLAKVNIHRRNLREVVDKVAAAFLLQGFLDSCSGRNIGYYKN